MTSIERTAYPRLTHRKIIPQPELERYYSLSAEEHQLVQQQARGSRMRLNFALQLKILQNLGYFVELDSIPLPIVKQVKAQLGLKGPLKIGYLHEETQSRHRSKIRAYLNIIRWNTQKPGNVSPSAQRFALQMAYQLSQTMNYPADIINGVLEALTQHRYELPAFNTIDRLVRHVRSRVNQQLFKRITEQLKAQQLIPMLDALLLVKDDYQRTDYQALKHVPKSPTYTHFRELLKHYQWLISFGDMSTYFQGIAKVKLTQFAVQAKAFDASDVKQLEENKRYALMAALIYQAQGEIRDALANTFCKTVFKLHKKAKLQLTELREQHTHTTQQLAKLLRNITLTVKDQAAQPNTLVDTITQHYQQQGGLDEVALRCERVVAYNSNNHLPLLWEQYQSKRSVLLALIRTLPLKSSTQQDALLSAIEILLAHAHRKAEYLTLDNPLDLSFASQQWRELVLVPEQNQYSVNRRYFELCVCTYIAYELRSGDIFIEGAQTYGDYRQDLLSWKECEPLLTSFCEEVELPSTAKAFTTELKEKLTQTAKKVDKSYPTQSELVIDEAGIPILKRQASPKNPHATRLATEIRNRLPERKLIDVVCSSHHYTHWADNFGPLSGAEPKMTNATERYIVNVFGNGTGMGPTQTARHVKADISPHILSWINRRHVTPAILDKVLTQLINYSNSFAIAKALGDETRCAADGKLYPIYEDNLISEPHIRYNNKGGIAYHHVADNYIALFSTFIPCGVWEAIAIIEGLLKNNSDIQPEIVHADTQGQSTPVFGLSFLLGIKLMPRIRNWKDLIFFRPDKTAKYKHIDALFGDAINWPLIETHWQDLMQVVLSIKQGKISSSLLLRKLGNYSRKNRLYLAFQELGRVVRTLFLLEYISNTKLRETITETTNKVEAYNGLSQWVHFGSPYMVASNDADEMEKAIKYNMIVANTIILQNIIDISHIIYQLQQEGWKIGKEDVAKLSPYLTAHIKRFGDYVVNLNPMPPIPDNVKAVALN